MTSTDHTCCLPLTCRQMLSWFKSSQYFNLSNVFMPSAPLIKHISLVLIFTTHSLYSSIYMYVQLLELILIPKCTVTLTFNLNPLFSYVHCVLTVKFFKPLVITPLGRLVHSSISLYNNCEKGGKAHC